MNWANILDFLRKRKRAYQLTFSSPTGQEVLHDLVKFCRANETVGVPGSPEKTWAAIGRNEVWLRIQQHMNFSPEELALLYNGHIINMQERNNVRR